MAVTLSSARRALPGSFWGPWPRPGKERLRYRRVLSRKVVWVKLCWVPAPSAEARVPALCQSLPPTQGWGPFEPQTESRFEDTVPCEAACAWSHVRPLPGARESLSARRVEAPGRQIRTVSCDA